MACAATGCPLQPSPDPENSLITSAARKRRNATHQLQPPAKRPASARVDDPAACKVESHGTPAAPTQQDGTEPSSSQQRQRELEAHREDDAPHPRHAAHGEHDEGEGVLFSPGFHTIAAGVRPPVSDVAPQPVPEPAGPSAPAFGGRGRPAGEGVENQQPTSVSSISTHTQILAAEVTSTTVEIAVRHGGATVAAGTRGVTAPPGLGAAAATATLSGAVQVAAGVPEQQQAPGTREAAAAEAVDDEEDAEDFAFDPFLFIKNLPPLAQCFPTARKTLLPRQTRRSKQKTLVLDLDETLVHSSLDTFATPDFTFPVEVGGIVHTVHVKKRPHLAQFLAAVSKSFEVVVFTASQRVYAEQLLNVIDPKREHIRYRLFRDACVYVDGNYLKDLSVLGRDLGKTIIVDNSPQAFGFQLSNGIPIESWYDDAADKELLHLLDFLDCLLEADDVRPVICNTFKLHHLVANA